MKLVTFRSLKDSIQANLIKSTIERAGYYCHLVHDTATSTDPFSPIAAGGIQVKIKEEDFDAVHDLLATEEE